MVPSGPSGCEHVEMNPKDVDMNCGSWLGINIEKVKIAGREMIASCVDRLYYSGDRWLTPLCSMVLMAGLLIGKK